MALAIGERFTAKQMWRRQRRSRHAIRPQHRCAEPCALLRALQRHDITHCVRAVPWYMRFVMWFQGAVQRRRDRDRTARSFAPHSTSTITQISYKKYLHVQTFFLSPPSPHHTQNIVIACQNKLELARNSPIKKGRTASPRLEVRVRVRERQELDGGCWRGFLGGRKEGRKRLWCKPGVTAVSM
jgi:hypothetical protein